MGRLYRLRSVLMSLPGIGLFSTFRRRPRGSEIERMQWNERVLQIDRDDVHASDDAPSRLVVLHGAMTMVEVLEHATAGGYLPQISGGRATWVAETNGGSMGALMPIAVLAQQWAEPRFLIASSATVSDHFGEVAPRLRFRYRCQVEPSVVLQTLA